MSGLLVLACGNPLRGDDGAAWRIAQALEESIHDLSADIRTLQQLTPELAEPISKAQTVLFVDIAAGVDSGRVSLESVEAAASAPPNLTHVFNPPALLAFSQMLYGKTPGRALLLTVGGNSFDFSDELSAAVGRGVSEAIEKIQSVLARNPTEL
jgi:hydrogenase maturation protease